MILGTLIAVTITGILLFIGEICFNKTRLFHSVALHEIQDTHQGYTAQVHSDDLIGLEGLTQTPLRPSGKVLINGVYYDVKTLGNYVAPGVTVVVTDITGTSLVVQTIHQA